MAPQSTRKCKFLVQLKFPAQVAVNLRLLMAFMLHLQLRQKFIYTIRIHSFVCWETVQNQFPWVINKELEQPDVGRINNTTTHHPSLSIHENMLDGRGNKPLTLTATTGIIRGFVGKYRDLNCSNPSLITGYAWKRELFVLRLKSSLKRNRN